MTPVVFRKWRKSQGGGILALFPTIPSDNLGYYCSSYEHVGQHGSADYRGCVQQTVPAKPEEYAALEKELTSIGYELQVVQRASPAMHAACRAEARLFRSIDVAMAQALNKEIAQSI
jgi:hypothetical protein